MQIEKLILVVILVGITSAAKSRGPVLTIPQMQSNINFFLNSTVKPQVKNLIVGNIQQFTPESVNAVNYELQAALNTLSHYDMLSPMGEWMEFTFANIKGLVAVPDYVADFSSDSNIDAQTDAAMQELNDIIALVYGKAQEIDPQCDNLTSSMTAFTTSVTTNVTNALNFMQNGFAADTLGEINLMKSTFTDFHNNITVCAQLRPLSVCKTCMINLLNNQGPYVVAYSQNLIYYIADLIDRFFRNFHEQMAWQAILIKKAYPNALNVC